LAKAVYTFFEMKVWLPKAPVSGKYRDVH